MKSKSKNKFTTLTFRSYGAFTYAFKIGKLQAIVMTTGPDLFDL
jgi:hypothetical protein